MTTGIEVPKAARGEHVVLFYRDEQELAGCGERVSSSPPLPMVTVRLSLSPRRITAGPSRNAWPVPVLTWRRPARAAPILEFDASETIRGFMVGDRPDPAGFWQVVSPLLRQAAQAGQPVLVFGEMVSLLWDAGLVNAAIEVEVMWNELGDQHPFSLLCAYPARPVTCSHYLDALTEVCRTHTEVTGSPPEPELADLPGS